MIVGPSIRSAVTLDMGIHYEETYIQWLERTISMVENQG